MDELARRLGTGEISPSALSDGAAAWAPVNVAPWGVLWYDYQRAVELDWMNLAVTTARRPIAEQGPGWAALEAEVARVKASPVERMAALMPLLLTPAVTPIYTAHARYQAALGATTLLVASERHRRKHGDWPASADAIDPEILPEPPLDPYTGRPYRFVRRDGELCIHSVGLNLKDEGGAYDTKQLGKRLADDVNATGWDVARRGKAAE